MGSGSGSGLGLGLGFMVRVRVRVRVTLEERRRPLSKESCLPKDRGREGGDSPDELPTESGLSPPGGRARGSALEPCISSLPELDPRRAACACACAG